MNMLCNNCTHDVLSFGVAQYSKRGINVKGSSLNVFLILIG